MNQGLYGNTYRTIMTTAITRSVDNTSLRRFVSNVQWYLFYIIDVNFTSKTE
jgi:hypothetical protein